MDVGYGTQISASSIQPAPPLPVCSSEVRFYGQLLVHDASNLKQDSIYSSKYVNMKVGEFFTVDHKLKTVSFYQSTSKNLKEHGFDVTVLEKVASGLSMLEGQSCASYKLVLLCFVPNSRLTHGLKFIDEKCEVKKFMTLAEWQESGDELALRTSAFIARICMYPGVPELSPRVAPKSKSFKNKTLKKSS